jgi:DNA polymerase III subunit chi
MPSIDFYMISAQGDQARLLFACRLLEKAYQQQHNIVVHVEMREKAQTLDNLLWTFRDDSFIPHKLQQEAEENTAPIQISYTSPLLSPSSRGLPAGSSDKSTEEAGSGSCGQAAGRQQRDILLNLHSEIPTFHGQFNRILEIFTSEPSMIELAQKHRVFYEEKGYKITTHNLNK